jgi:hypothetical protein
LSYVFVISGLIAALGFIIVGAALAAAALVQLKVARAAQRWPSALAEVRASRIQTTVEGLYRPYIEYAYTVNGQVILSTRRAFFRMSSRDRVWADIIVSKYPVGSRVTAYYDPSNPSQCVLDRESTIAAGMVMPIIGLGFAALGIAGLEYIVRFVHSW